MIKFEPLNGTSYGNTTSNITFLYEINLINAKVNGTKDVLYNFNKNFAYVTRSLTI